MLQRITVRLATAATWPRVGLLLMAYGVLIWRMTVADDQIKALSDGLGVPDLMVFFTADELYARLSTFGDEGRSIYLKAEVLDLVYPLVYTATFVSILALAIRRRFGDGSQRLMLCSLPVLVMLFDYIENAGFLTVLLAWPARVPAAAWVAATGNGAKWTILGATIPLVAVGLLDSAVHGVRWLLGGERQ